MRIEEGDRQACCKRKVEFAREVEENDGLSQRSYL
jgi:hypothetical protein